MRLESTRVQDSASGKGMGISKSYKRYIDDICHREGTAHQVTKLSEGLEDRLNNLDEWGGSVQVDPIFHIEATQEWEEGGHPITRCWCHSEEMIRRRHRQSTVTWGTRRDQ